MGKGVKQRPKRTLLSAAKKLREEAAQRLAKLADEREAPRVDEVDTRQLLHELEVHKIELETQNEELLAARVELEHGLARYTELFDFAPIGYAVLDPSGLVREVNHTAARLLGRERARLVEQPFARFVATRDVATFATMLKKVLATEAKQSCELELQAGPQNVVQSRLTAVALAGADSTVMLAFEDITERKQKEALLAASEQALREADRRKDDFLALLSHELRNPLAPIRTGLFVLSRVFPDSPEARNMHAIIDRQVTHLTRLINDLLDVTRIRRGKIQLQPEWTDLCELVRNTIDDHRRSFELRSIALECRIVPESLFIQADPARMTQVLSNLLGNAEKFTKRGGKVLVTLEAEQDQAVLRVGDNGVGISSEDLEHVFEPFTQASQTLDRTRGGLGLGLSMVKGLVELHEGVVHIRSAGIGQGTEVSIKLPIGAHVGRPAQETKPALAHKARLLVIDDHGDAADTLASALAYVGHEVEVAYDGQAGLDRARTSRPDVVICDIGLPGMNGYEVAHAMRADPRLRGVYLVALSGYARPEDRKRAEDAGFDRHMAKPADLQTLTQIIAEAGAPWKDAAAAPLERPN